MATVRRATPARVVQAKGLTVGTLGALVAAEDLAAGLVQNAFVDEPIDCSTGLEGGVQLNDRIRPEESGRELLLHAGADALVANHDEAPREVRVVLDEAVSQVKDVHLVPAPSS
jgi:hypothetical protein